MNNENKNKEEKVNKHNWLNKFWIKIKYTNHKRKKFLLVFPPLYFSELPQLGIHSLIGQLRGNGYNVSFINLNKLLNNSNYVFKNTEYPYKDLTYDAIYKYIFSEKNYYSYLFKEIVCSIKKQKYDYIGISIGLDSQLIAGLTIAAILKKETNAHINIGGNYITRISENIMKYTDFFDTYAHSISYGEGEISIIELAKYIENKITIDQVPNLIYKSKTKVVKNEIAKSVKLSEIKIPDYSDIDFSKNQKQIIPLTVNRGCYWGKCSFCDMSYSLPFSVKKIDKVIEEIKVYKEKYNISNFYIVDESVIPEYLDKFCDAIIENNLNINISMSMRFDRISKTLLEKAYKAGIKDIAWGLESANPRILNLINKGINLQDIEKIIRYSAQAKIKNIIYVFFNFPTETYQEAMDTVTFLKKVYKYLFYISYGEFGLGRYSKIALNPKKYNIELAKEQKDFSHALGFKVIGEYKSKEEQEKILKEIHKIQLLIKENNKKYMKESF